MEHKTNEVYITGIEQDQGIIRAIFSVMGNVDYGNDRIHNGAFAKTFLERGHKVLVLDQHRTDSINRAIAKPVHLREMGRDELPMELLQHYPDATGGAEITAQFSLEDEDSKKAFFRLKNGWVKEWSFGYDAFDTSFSREERGGKNVSIREIRTIKLYEVSPVLFGMNDATMTTDAKMSAERQIERIKAAFEFWQKDDGLEFVRLDGHDLIATKDGIEFTVLYSDKGESIEFEILSGGELMMTEEKVASGKMNLPLASRDMAWDSGKAIASIRNATGSADAPSARYKDGFFWYDAEKEDDFTAYKLPFAQEVDGSLKAVPKAIFAVAAVLQGGRGGVDIPDADKEAVKAKVSGYYAKMKSEFGDDSIVPPWQKEESEKGDGEAETEQKESVQAEPDKEPDTPEEEKAGRAISANNETRIRNAITGLQSAMEALNGMLPMDEDEPDDTMELDDNLNTVTVSKGITNVFNMTFPQDFDVDAFIKAFNIMTEKQSEHETETEEAGPIEPESPNGDVVESPTDEPEVKESPFDFEKALLELANLKTEIMEVQDNE